MTDRSRAVLIAGAIAVCLIAGSPPRIVGDGGEYLAQALNFASFHGPSIGHKEIPDIERQIGEAAPYLEAWELGRAAVLGRNGGRDFVHFWFYAFLATPAVWIVTALHLPPVVGFTVTNLLLLALALWVVYPKIGGAATLLLFAGPIVWWVDKAHTEVFTFALLTIAFATIEDRPWWAMVAAATASTQNPPIAVVLVLLAAAAVVSRPAFVSDRRFQAGAIAAVALALLHPAYTYWRHGTVSLLLGTTRAGLPSFAEVSAVVMDPTIGLVGNYPFFLLVVAAGTVVLASRTPRALLHVEMVLTLVTAGAFLSSFARATNQHHGGTPSLSRYAVWLMPLAVPLLHQLHLVGGRAWRPFLATTATMSAFVSVFAFNPSVPQYSHEPTWLASYLWTKHPGWNNPLPEVFMDTNLHLEQPWVPVTTPNCEKILIGGGRDEGVWPIPCYPDRVPEQCLERAAMCYANLRGDHYDFVRAPGRWDGAAPLRREWVWPASAETFVRTLYETWQWRSLGFRPQDFEVLRQGDRVHATVLGGAERFILILQDIEEGAALMMRPPGAMAANLIDPTTGTVVGDVSFGGGAAGDDLWTVPLPPGYDLLLLTARLEPPK